jgi:hypothetical protein
MKKILVILAIAFIATSCYNTRIFVGNVKPNDPVKEVNKVWTHHFLFGLVPGNNAKMNPSEYVGGKSDYVVRTNMNFWNSIVGGVTIGIYTPTQTTYYLPINEKDFQ